MNAPVIADPRPSYFAAADWVGDLLDKVCDDQWSAATPCAEFDVAALAAHIIAVCERVAVIGAGGDFAAIDAAGSAHDVDSFRYAVERCREIWSDDDTLARDVTVPWGEMPGAAALWGYVNELLVHGWDLATATDQPSEVDPELVEPVLKAMQQFLPAHIRGSDEVPFGKVVVSRPDAGATERLANWAGHAAVR